MVSETLRISTSNGDSVAGLLLRPQNAKAAFVFAHGAGAPMTHPFMTALAIALADRDISTLRFNFPSMDRGVRRPDSPPVAHDTIRAAVDSAQRLLPGVPLLAGGKSFGGRMTSQTHAQAPLPGVQGLIFVGFPLHPVGKPAIDRAAHLSATRGPLLFLQGTRDELAQLELMRQVMSALGERAALRVFDDADHSFHVRKQSGSTDSQVLQQMADAIGEWISGLRRKEGAVGTHLE